MSRTTVDDPDAAAPMADSPMDSPSAGSPSSAAAPAESAEDPSGSTLPSWAATATDPASTAGAGASAGDTGGGGWSWSDADSELELPPSDDRYVRGAVISDSAMSTVRLAQDPVLKRQVVLKSVGAGGDSHAARRLLREARITAALAHPGVVSVLDAGVGAGGETWFAMPAVQGETLAERLAGGAPGPSLLALLVDAARVVARAHEAGIVHRDLKLENILVDDEGIVMVMDWGIARPESAESAWDAVLSVSHQTAVGQVLGTPETMSPEQVIGARVDRRADVWALGVCVVELVTGTPPFARASPAETMRAVVHADLPQLSGPLGALVARCVVRDPVGRLADAGAFARALEAALVPTPAPVSPPARGRGAPARWALGGGALGGLGVALLFWGWSQTTAPAAPSDPDPGVADAALRALAVAAARDGDLATAGLLAADGLGSHDDPHLRGILAAQPLGLLRVAEGPLPACRAMGVSPDGRRLVCTEPGGVSVVDLETGTTLWRKPVELGYFGFAGDLLVGWVGGDTGSRTFDLATGEGRSDLVAFDSGGRPMPSATAGALAMVAGGSLVVTELRSQRRVVVGEEVLSAMVLDRDRMVTVGRDAVQLWDRSGVPLGPPVSRESLDPADSVWAGAASADGRWYVTGSLAGVVRVWDLDRREARVTRLLPGMVRDVAISPGGRWIAAVDEAGQAWLWPRGEGAARVQLPRRASQVSFPSETTLATLDTVRTVWRLPSIDLLGRRGMSGGVTGVDWAGDWIAASLSDGSVERWRPGQGDRERRSVLTGNVSKDVSIRSDGSVLGASVEPGAPSRWLWSAETEEAAGGDGAEGGAPSTARPDLGGCRRVAWFGEGLAACQPQGPGPRVVAADGRRFPALGLAATPLVDLEPVPGGEAVVMIDELGEIWVVQAEDGPRLVPLATAGFAGAVALAREGPAYVGRDLRVVELPRDGSAPVELHAPGRVVDLAVSPSGELLAAGLLDGGIAVWRTDERRLLGVLTGHRERVVSVAFDDGGTRLVSGSWDDTVRTWDLAVLEAPVDALVRQSADQWPWTAAEALSW